MWSSPAAIRDAWFVRRWDFSWVPIPGVLDDQGQPMREKGVVSALGIYFASLPFAISPTWNEICDRGGAALLADDIQRRAKSATTALIQ
jgi:putative flavoprotein involved in K+ transport